MLKANTVSGIVSVYYFAAHMYHRRFHIRTIQLDRPSLQDIYMFKYDAYQVFQATIIRGRLSDGQMGPRSFG